MKKTLYTLLVVLFLPLIIKADPPKKILLNFNAETQKLKIEAIHPVKDVQKHFIDLIVIYVNGKEVKTIKPLAQSDLKGETIELEVPQIVKGCEITVKAQCNEFGSKKVTQKLK